MRRNSQRQPRHCPICQEKQETHTKWSNYLIKKTAQSAIWEWSWRQPGLSHALFCHLHPQYKCKNVKTRGEIEWQWIHSDAGCEPLTEDINYSAVTITLPICKLMLSSNCTRPGDCLTNLSKGSAVAWIPWTPRFSLSLSTLLISVHSSLFCMAGTVIPSSQPFLEIKLQISDVFLDWFH